MIASSVKHPALSIAVFITLAIGAVSVSADGLPSPAGLVIQAPPASDGFQLFTIQAENVTLQEIIPVLSRRAGVDFRLDPQISGNVLGEPLRIDLRQVSLEDAVEILAGMTGLDHEIGHNGAFVNVVHLKAPHHADEQERADRLLRKAHDTYMKLLLKYPEHAAALDAQFRIAGIHFEQKQYALAAQDYNEILKRDTTGKYTSETLYRLGWCYSNLGDYNQSSKAFYAFLDRSTDSPKAALALLALARSAMSTGEKREAQRVYQRLLLDHPKAAVVPEAQHELADLLFGQHEFAAAERQYMLLNESFPQHKPREVKLRIGKCRMQLEQYDVAARRFAEVMKSDTPDALTADSYHLIAICLDRMGRYLESLEAYIGAAARFPEHDRAPDARARVVELYRRMGLLESAITYGKDAVGRLEGHAARPVKGQLAQAMLEAGEFEDARKKFEELAQEAGPGISRTAAMIYAADAARKLEQFDRAELLYRSALSSRLDDAERRRALLGIGDTYLARGDYERAALAYKGQVPAGN